SHLELDEPAAEGVLGYARISIQPPERAVKSRPQATTWLGYELLVSARRGGRELGSTLLRLKPSAVPPLRLRATPVLAEAGKPLVIELIRGPSFTGALPEKLWLSREQGGSLEAVVDKKARRATFQLPESASG